MVRGSSVGGAFFFVGELVPHYIHMFAMVITSDNDSTCRECFTPFVGQSFRKTIHHHHHHRRRRRRRRRNREFSCRDNALTAYQGVRKVRFSENLMCFVSFKHPSWDSTFSLITDEVRACFFIRKHFEKTPQTKNSWRLAQFKRELRLFLIRGSKKIKKITSHNFPNIFLLPNKQKEISR